MDWDKYRAKQLVRSAQPDSEAGEVVLISWIDGSKKPKQARKFSSVASAVRFALNNKQGATITKTGTLSVPMEGEFGRFTLHVEIFAHGKRVSGATWRALL